ncbi:MAG: hypothetical protein Q7R33_10235 [Nitrosarchaeum sp.]|nr:hypothetical protein [Nitrosarchaeum sp.]
MIIPLLVAQMMTGIGCTGEHGCEVSIQITATIVPAERMAMNVEDMGIIGVDAYRVAIAYVSSGEDSVHKSEEYFVMRRPGSTDDTPMYASIDSSGEFIFVDELGKPTEMIAMRWDAAKPIIAALYKGRFLMAWKNANKLIRG